MSHLNWPGFRGRDPARSAAGATAGRHHPLTAALFSSLCLMSCFAAAAQAHELTASPTAKLAASQINGSAGEALSRYTRAGEPCGYYTIPATGPDLVYWRHCDDIPICIKVDERFTVDRRVEVGPRENKRLGTTAGVRGAWYIGLPHPRLGCDVF